MSLFSNFGKNIQNVLDQTGVSVSASGQGVKVTRNVMPVTGGTEVLVDTSRTEPLQPIGQKMGISNNTLLLIAAGAAVGFFLLNK